MEQTQNIQQLTNTVEGIQQQLNQQNAVLQRLEQHLTQAAELGANAPRHDAAPQIAVAQQQNQQQVQQQQVHVHVNVAAPAGNNQPRKKQQYLETAETKRPAFDA